MTLFSRLSRVYYTLKPLRCEQFLFRLMRKLLPLRQLVLSHPMGDAKLWHWSGPEFMAPSILDDGHLCFLNIKRKIQFPADWNSTDCEKLWLYNLHYFDDLNAVDSSSRNDAQYSLVKRWIADNPPVAGNGWEPYTLSLRLVNWIKWYGRSTVSDEEIISSISQQAEALSKQLEYHILGNHLFANAKALVFVGCFFGGARAEEYLQVGLHLLNREIKEQFLPDGGHFELSPMYHCILLWDVLDLINLARIVSDKIPEKEVKNWKKVAKNALKWLRLMSHPDGEIAFFNDCAIGIASPPSKLSLYANLLSVGYQSEDEVAICTLDESGYSRIAQSEYTIFFDHADIGPSYLPAHGHADTLSIECSLGSDRVIVNSGTSVYGLSRERLRQRQTAAHSTLVIDGLDSSEVWSGFRVARRAEAKLERAFVSEGVAEITATHNGYKRFEGRGTHTRSIFSKADCFTVVDKLIGKYDGAYSVFHLHPKVKVETLTDSKVCIITPSGTCFIVSTASSIDLHRSTWHPSFGVSLDSLCLKVPMISNELSIEFRIVQE